MLWINYFIFYGCLKNNIPSFRKTVYIIKQILDKNMPMIIKVNSEDQLVHINPLNLLCYSAIPARNEKPYLMHLLWLTCAYSL